MRILMITVRADPGGGPEHLFQLVHQIKGEHEVYIAAPREEPYWDRFVSLVGIGRMIEIKHRRVDLGILRHLRSFVREKKIDIVHSHGRGAGALSRLLRLLNGPKCIHTPHGPLIIEGPKQWLYWLLEFMASLVTSKTIAVSESESEILKRQFLHLGNLLVIENGVPTPNVFCNGALATRSPRVLVHVTRFVFQKNTEMLIPIAKELRKKSEEFKYRFVILGDGPGRAEFEAAVQAENLSPLFDFRGAVPAIQPILAESHAFISTSRWEGLPLAVLEALSVGLPVIASNVPGNCDVVTDQVGALFSLEDPIEAAEKIARISGDESLWIKLSSNAAQLAKERYSTARMAKETLACYEGHS